MALIKDKHLVSDDPWISVADDQPIPDSGDVIVGYARFDREDKDLTLRNGRLGLRIDPEDDLLQVVTHLPKVGVLAINFPKFGDGRGYTKARLLRERYGYKGELRAVGEVLGDQLFFMLRCGFNAFELAPGKNVELALKCFDDFSVTYQAATDDPRPLYRRAHRGEHA
ncbi:MAG: Oxidoreductase in sulfite reduction [Myxococcaceae bacterium]|nr:Oxidoreductase in sulfite reduction [Myxococcaceae bacterium]